MPETTFEVVRRILVESLNINETLVTLEARLIEDLNADSLDAVELIMALEEEFNAEIEPAQVEEIKTIQDLVSLIDSMKA